VEHQKGASLGWVPALPSNIRRLSRDKHTSLLRKSVNYCRKKFYCTGPRSLVPDFKVVNDSKFYIFTAENKTHHASIFVDGCSEPVHVRLHRLQVDGNVPDLHLKNLAGLVNAYMARHLVKYQPNV
jgi:hypothetical protein